MALARTQQDHGLTYVNVRTYVSQMEVPYVRRHRRELSPLRIPYNIPYVSLTLPYVSPTHTLSLPYVSPMYPLPIPYNLPYSIGQAKIATLF